MNLENILPKDAKIPVSLGEIAEAVADDYVERLREERQKLYSANTKGFFDDPLRKAAESEMRQILRGEIEVSDENVKKLVKIAQILGKEWDLRFRGKLQRQEETFFSFLICFSPFNFRAEVTIREENFPEAMKIAREQEEIRDRICELHSLLSDQTALKKHVEGQVIRSILTTGGVQFNLDNVPIWNAGNKIHYTDHTCIKNKKLLRTSNPKEVTCIRCLLWLSKKGLLKE
ncbi:MAG: hypothetical protein D6698_04045 [Gammaproteobacteria bacterium]|nr:MAG: hypothetical protein D6698_04045 [Gammaproteobacteria bacterium]